MEGAQIHRLGYIFVPLSAYSEGGKTLKKNGYQATGPGIALIITPGDTSCKQAKIKLVVDMAQLLFT